MLPDDVTGTELDEEALEELRTLPKDLAARVARHLVMAGRMAEEDPELAYKHARAARRLASRVGIVREAAGLAAYAAGEWADALAELRAARRLGAGDEAYLPVMADAERGLGRPERALDVIKSPEAARLDQMGAVELRIVESGVRRDLGQFDAAVVTLQVPELQDRRLRPWSARLFYAYADALVDAGREDEASEWFARSAAADRDAETDAAERYAELEGLDILDTEEDEDADGELIDAEAETLTEADEASAEVPVEDDPRVEEEPQAPEVYEGDDAVADAAVADAVVAPAPVFLEPKHENAEESEGDESEDEVPEAKAKDAKGEGAETKGEGEDKPSA
ncbi:tetratricopeptide repeat protein [Actinomadura harenae]|uniref:hypothetical protein n=1 Tax=Actinomadura harenae TaxID=2483351 RepID=UPI001F48916B|nr:hypothetical protein [Actinomadura harenae]